MTGKMDNNETNKMATQKFDVVIRGAHVVDGTGAPGFDTDVGITGERIASVGNLANCDARREIDARGLTLTPGFIDAHTHDDRLLLSDPSMTPKVSQGVTTIIGGNCGISLAPMPGVVPSPVTPPLDLLDDTGRWFQFATFAEYLNRLRSEPAATNCAMLVGHTTLRVITMSDVRRAATRDEIAVMRRHVEEGLDAGAIGVSTGLAYPPAISAPTQEVIEVCRPLTSREALYCTHMRDEGDRVAESLEETFEIGRQLGVAVVISHHKVVGEKNYGRSAETLDLIRKAMQSQRVCLDCYPYAASSTILAAHLARTCKRVTITWSRGMPQYAGADLDEVIARVGGTMEEVIAKLLPAGAIYYRMDEPDVRRILAFDETMIGSDGLPHDERPHPRLWATFPRVLGHYGRSLGLFSFEKAIHKMTGLTARNFGLTDRGEIREGAYADLVLLNRDTVAEGADYPHPIGPAIGIDTVLVNGRAVWTQGQATGERPGRVLGGH